jgi:hypothetical protein
MLIERYAFLLTLSFGSSSRLPRTSKSNLRKLRARRLSAPPRVTTSCGARTCYLLLLARRGEKFFVKSGREVAALSPFKVPNLRLRTLSTPKRSSSDLRLSHARNCQDSGDNATVGSVTRDSGAPQTVFARRSRAQ